MKNKNALRYIYNPFEKIAGWQALIYGLIIACLSGWIGKQAGLMFDGAIDAHFGNEVSYYQAFMMLFIDIACVGAVMYLAGLLVTRNFRFIDLLGTMTLARAPYLLLSLTGLFVTIPETAELLANPALIFSNAWKVSTGAKGSKMIIAFIAGLFVAEVISKILISILI